MDQKIDLRSYNIKDRKSAIEFMELIVAKTPQLVQFLKKQELENQSLVHKNITLQEQNDQLRNVVPVEREATDLGVSDRLAGKTVVQATESERLAQMAAASADAPPAPELPEITANPNLLPVTPAAPGDIGNLNIPPPVVNTPPLPPSPDATVDAPPAPPVTAPPVEPPLPEDTNLGGLSTDDIDLDPPVDPPAAGPSTTDTTGIGDRVAAAQHTDKQLKKLNRPSLNELAVSLGVENPDGLETNGQVRKAILAKEATAPSNV